MLPAYALPDKLHILVGRGGASGANLGAGGLGGNTLISLVPITTTTANGILNAQGNSGGGAGGGSGGVPSGTTNATVPFAGWGKVNQNVPAQQGQSGQNPTVNFDQTRIVGGGAGGSYTLGNTQAAGRSVTSSYKQPSAVTYSQGQAVGVSGSAGSGPNLMSPQPQFFGGAGGASVITTNTVNGGDGAIGCGGGGAGPNLSGGSSIGGRGGNGLVIITCW
jgi:hypothetical protein